MNMKYSLENGKSEHDAKIKMKTRLLYYYLLVATVNV